MMQYTKSDVLREKNAMSDVDLVADGSESRLRAHFAEQAFLALIQKVDPRDGASAVSQVANMARHAGDRMIVELRKDPPKRGAF